MKTAENDIDLSRKSILKMRLEDLLNQLEKINGYSSQEYEDYRPRETEVKLSDQELSFMDVQEIYKGSDILRALDLCCDELQHINHEDITQK